MTMIKRTTQGFFFKQKRHHVYPDWEMHPSLLTGLAGLEAYNRWVSEVLMPIVYQWIDEHKDEVYKSVPEKYKDDVGVVVAAAFGIVEALPGYQKGLQKAQEYEEEVKKGEWDSSTINPLWAGIAKKIREGTKRSFEEDAEYLKDTIR